MLLVGLWCVVPPLFAARHVSRARACRGAHGVARAAIGGIVNAGARTVAPALANAVLHVCVLPTLLFM